MKARRWAAAGLKPVFCCVRIGEALVERGRAGRPRFGRRGRRRRAPDGSATDGGATGGAAGTTSGSTCPLPTEVNTLMQVQAAEAQPPWVEVGVTIPLPSFFLEAFRGIHLLGDTRGPATCTARVQASAPPAIPGLI